MILTPHGVFKQYLPGPRVTAICSSIWNSLLRPRPSYLITEHRTESVKTNLVLPCLLVRTSLLMVSACELGRGVFGVRTLTPAEALHLLVVLRFPFCARARAHTHTHTHTHTLYQLFPSQTPALQLSILIGKKNKRFLFPLGCYSWLK